MSFNSCVLAGGNRFRSLSRLMDSKSTPEDHGWFRQHSERKKQDRANGAWRQKKVTHMYPSNKLLNSHSCSVYCLRSKYLSMLEGKEVLYCRFTEQVAS